MAEIMSMVVIYILINVFLHSHYIKEERNGDYYDRYDLRNWPFSYNPIKNGYVAIVIYNHEPYKSNEIVFTNARPLTDNIILNSIKLEHSTNSKEAYPLYGQHN